MVIVLFVLPPHRFTRLVKLLNRLQGVCTWQAKQVTQRRQGAEQREVFRPSGSHSFMAQMGTSGENSALFGEPRAGFQAGRRFRIFSWPTWCTPRSSRARSWSAPAACWALLAGSAISPHGRLLKLLARSSWAFSPNMTVLIWGGRAGGPRASFMIPSVLGRLPRSITGRTAQAYGCIGAAFGSCCGVAPDHRWFAENAGFRFTYIVLGCYLPVLLLSFKLPAIEEGGDAVKSDFTGWHGPAAAGLFLFSSVCRVFRYGASPMPSAEAPFTIFGLSPALSHGRSGPGAYRHLLFVEEGVSRRRRAARFFLRRS